MLNEADIMKFYELYRHLDIKSPNIGIVGDTYKFRRYTNDFIKKYKKRNKDIKIICSREGKQCTILIDDIEISFMKISTYQDLTGYKFRKYL